VPFPGMSPVISEGCKPDRPKLPAMITDALCVRCGEMPRDFTWVAEHHHQPSDRVDDRDTPIALERSPLFCAEAERRFENFCRPAQPVPPRSALRRDSVSLRNVPILIATTAVSANAVRVALRPIGLSGAFFSSTSHTTM